MRRFIAYLLIALALLTGIGVTFNPLFSKMNAGREFTNSYEVVYNIEGKDGAALGKNAVDKVADEMRARLDTSAVEDYTVKTQGEDTISVSFAADESEFSYIVRYLKHSGDRSSYSLIGEKDEQYAPNVFVGSKAYIKKVQDVIPYVIIPISDKTAVEQFLKTIDEEDSGEKSQRAVLKEDEQSDENKINVYLVQGWEDADSFDDISNDPHIAEKVLMQFSSKNIWYEDSEEEHTELQYLCGTADSDGNYDLNNLKFANQKARFLVNMFNASSYDVNVSALYVTESASNITFNYNQVKATAENLLVFSNNVNVAASITLISLLIALAIVSLLLIVFYRTSAVAVIVSSLSSIYLTYVAFIFMGGLFNIPAIIGGIALIGCALFGQIHYLNRFKDEVYKGRSLRKANQEAAKKSTLVNIDASVIFAFAGLMLYVIGGAAIKPLGIILFFGSIISLLMNLIVFRFMMYLLTNTTSFQNKYSLFAIDEKNVPSVLEDKKSEYIAPYEKVDFTKHKKISAIVLATLALASVVGISVFGAIKGSPLNVENSAKDYSALYVSVTGDNTVIVDEDSFNDHVLKFIKLDEKSISVDASKAITYQKVTLFDSEEKVLAIEPDNVFRVNLNTVLDKQKVEYSLDEGATYVVADEGIEEAIENIVMNVEHINLVDKISVKNRVTHETVLTPSQARIAIATAALVAGASLYFMFRFRISRGVSALVIASGSSLIAYGVLVLTRLATTSLAAIAMPVVALNALLVSGYYFLKEKELIKESKEELTYEVRSSLMKKALSLAATSTIVFSIVAIYIAINYFGFGLESLAYLFADILLGNVIALVAVLTILGPLAMLIEKGLRKIRLPKFAHKEKKQKIKVHEPKTSEPEERIYIGIND